MAILNPTKIATLDNTPTFGHFADGLGLYFIRPKLLGIPLHGPRTTSPDDLGAIDQCQSRERYKKEGINRHQ